MTARLAVILFLMACGPQPGDTPNPTTGDGGATTADGASMTDTGELAGQAEVVDNPNNPFSVIVRLTVDQDAQVVVEYGEGALTHQAPSVRASADQPVDVLVLGLRADRSYQLRATVTADEQAWVSDELLYTTAPLPNDWPVCTPTFLVDETSFDSDEVTCGQSVTSSGRSIYYCVDYWGEPTFSIQTPDNEWLMSVRPLQDGGWASTSFTSSKLIFFDAFGLQTAQYTDSWFDGVRFTHEFIDPHEVLQLSQGRWAGALVFVTVSYETFDDGTFLAGNGLIVYDPASEQVLYDYSFHGDLGDQVAMDDKLPYDRLLFGDFAEDWTHVNSVAHGIDADGREFLLLSLRSQDWLVKLYPDTDELGWAFGFGGDFALVDDVESGEPQDLDPVEWAYHQHGAVILDAGPLVDEADGRLHVLLLDNGEPRNDGTDYSWDLGYSRVVQFDLDEQSLQAEIDFDWGPRSASEDGHFFSATCGSVELLREQDRLMALDGEGATRIELSYPEGEQRWRMSCETTAWCEGRVSWFPSLYERTWIYD